ncbi:MAG: T9SS type A sorting domain-containing protein, partial [Bacteroidota bacterium]|nr:T9SS type A sorting domain-containing protein [Bacteroidota bacterium]
NPVQNGLVTLQMNNMPKGVYMIRLVNSSGQTVVSKQINHSEGTSTETLGVNKVKGSYMLEVTKPDNTKSTNKLIIN